MKRILTAMALILGLTATTHAMSVDDIIELCRAGFEPERIASIVEATGLDEPIGASDWVRMKEEGCGEELVDALLAVLVPVDESEEYTGATGSTYSRSGYSDVNVYVHGGYGSRWNNWWYGGFSMGWYDPYWSIGWTYWDPYWYSTWWGYRPYYYHYAWWGHPWYGYCQPRHCWSCYDPYWFSGSGGQYARYKASRRGSLKGDSYSYAGAKTWASVDNDVMSTVRAKSTVAAGVGSGGSVLRPKSVTTGSGTPKSTTGSTTYTTRKSDQSTGVGTIKSGTTTGTPATIRPKSTTSGTGSKATGGTSQPTTKPKGTTGTSKPSQNSDDGGTTKTPAVTTPKSSDPGQPSKSGTPKARSKSPSQSYMNKSTSSVRYTTARQERSVGLAATQYKRSAPGSAPGTGLSNPRATHRAPATTGSRVSSAPPPQPTASRGAPKMSQSSPPRSAPAPAVKSFGGSFSGGSRGAASSGGGAVARPK